MITRDQLVHRLGLGMSLQTGAFATALGIPAAEAERRLILAEKRRLVVSWQGASRTVAWVLPTAGGVSAERLVDALMALAPPPSEGREPVARALRTLSNVLAEAAKLHLTVADPEAHLRDVREQATRALAALGET